jgi:hypothetical protein
MFELIMEITVCWLLVNSFLVENKRFALQPDPVRRPLRLERYRSLKELG